MKQTNCESMDDNPETVSTTDQECTFPNACGDKHNVWKSIPNPLLTKKDNLSFQEPDQENCNPCSSAKQYRKMQELEHGNEEKTLNLREEMGLSYEWQQTMTYVSVEIELKGKPFEQKVFDISFTSKEALISLAEKTHVIQFYDLIQKEKSRVQMKKGKVYLLVIKENPGDWPALEFSGDDATSGSTNSFPNSFHKGGGDDQTNGSACGMQNVKISNEHAVKDNLMGGDHNHTESSPDDPALEIADKEDEPVYHLKDLKHEFFERGSILTLQVFIKSTSKDSVKIVFNQKGFVLKLHTSDEKFLKLHEGTSSETTFSWSVTTRKDIVPEESKFKVKANVIEVCLQKLLLENWTSLEAPVRKEISEHTKSDTWLPIGGCVQAATSNKSSLSSSMSSSSSSSSLSSSCQSMSDAAMPSTSTPLSASVSPVVSSSSNHSENKKASSNVMFDELSTVNLKDSKPTPNVNYRDEEEDTNLPLSGSVKLRSNTPQDWPKPMAKVQPLNKQPMETSNVVMPGYAGLVNLGNTCFMNCVLQVLANSREFRDYFLDGRFQDEINEDNPLGMKGQLAATFGVLLRWLWSCKKHCWEPRKLKDLISKKNPQFFGYAQHDAHEFLAFLLDGLHEDLNRIRKKPYTETVDSNGRPDEVVAAEAWNQYRQRNDSVVVDLFQGQYKSKLVCPKCGKVSITFDPFLYLSVPLPKKKKKIPITFMWRESYKRPAQYQILIPQEANVEFLKEELSQRTGVKASDMRVFEAYRGRIHKMFLAGSSLASVESKDIIIVSEVLSEELAGEEVLELPVMQRTLFPSDYPTRCAFCHKLCSDGTSLKRCGKCWKVGYCDHTCQRNHWSSHKPQCSNPLEPVGCPFILSIPASRATYSNVIKHMEGYARFSVNIFQPPIKSGGDNKTKMSSSHSTNLTSSCSQSSSSLNSLDSLSSASSTCTLTGDQSDPQALEDNEANGNNGSAETDGLSNTNPSPALQPPMSSDTKASGDCNDSAKSANGAAALDNSSAKGVPMSHVMGVPAKEADRDKATPTFIIRPVNMDGVSFKGDPGLEDKGDVPLDLISHKFLSMDWKNDERLPSYVLVRSKELDADEVDDLNNINNMSNKPSLYQCLELFTEPEVLSPEEAWYCPSCKKHVEASKQMAIWKLPHTLVIQLKRFSFQNFLMRSKITKNIDFPTRGLDLQRFCVGVGPNEPKPIYDLYGVANHHGLLIGGHYTSFVRCAGDSGSNADEAGWRLCDDSRVSPIANEKSVVTSDAYLLFYRRRGLSATIGPTVSMTTAEGATGNENRSSSNRHAEGSFSSPTPSSSSSCFSSSVDTSTRLGVGSAAGAVAGASLGTEASPCEHRTNQDVSGQEGDEEGPSGVKAATSTSSGVGGSTGAGLSEFEPMEEKCDWEKAYDDLGSESDGTGDERNLVIDTNSSDLGYTDMEAVD